ncbi:MAG: sigma-70 family RNA polymerase sigma factor [Chitinophagaceae bacterium]
MLPQSATDAQLVQAFINGNESALEQLVIRYKDKIYTGIYMLVKDKYLAEDLFQDAFLKMVRKMREGQYAEQGKFLPWASRIAHNLCMDHFRRTKRRLPIVMTNGDDLLEFLAGPESRTPDIETRQTERGLTQLLERLPEEQREVIVMRIYGEMSFKEIAGITNVSINTALGRMRYGLINMRKMIGDFQMALR